MEAVIQTIVSHPAFKYFGIAVCFLGLLFLTWLMVRDAEGSPRRLWAQYCAYLERKLKILFIWTPGDRIAMGQAVAMFLIAALGLFAGIPYWWAFLFLAIAGPPAYIERMRRQRIAQIEKQLDGFILAMANALKATPSIGDAFISVQPLIRPPLQQEVELAIKEMRVGSTLDQALLLMASRIGSRQVDAALSTLLIGRQVGGNLPKILDNTAATLREMSRLDAVVRTKTAEGKAQLGVLAVFPLVLFLAFSSVKERYFEPLFTSFIGYIIVAVALACWVASIIWARKIISVDV